MQNTDVKQELGVRFKEVRNQLRYTQEVFAESIDIKRAMLGQIEIGKTFPHLLTVIKLHRTYNVSLEWLLTGIGGMFLNKSNVAKLTDIYPDLPEAGDWEKLLSILVRQPQQAFLRILELKKQEVVEAGMFLEMGYETIQNKKIIEGAYKAKTGIADKETESG